ncbi:hypothetical protein CISIN_1g033243mg [Citrus sinensis]|uniref:Uncharacterized protein n=1 Tax=Citrus sinensis TaxID=2711 RepID=A0A067E2J3_CITSI|nr:hypothetical protein CISIN_1g033243mg [Citrus sinensis]
MWRYPFPANCSPNGWHKSRRQLGCGSASAAKNIPCDETLRGCTQHDNEGGDDDMGVGPAVDEDTATAGTVPVPVAAMMEGSACRSSHSMVSPSDRWPSSLVSWKIRAAQRGGIRTRRPRPLTLV